MSKINRPPDLTAWRFLSTIRAGLTGLFPAVVERWRHRQTMATLSNLDRRQLEDIGMSPNDILRISVARLSSRPERVQDPWGRLCQVAQKDHGAH